MGLDRIENKPENYLVFLKDRAPNDEGLIGEKVLLENPLIDELCAKMCEDYEPKHKYAIFSLCTSTRPYINSPKWKSFYKNFGHVADLIICSNGGIIPIEYQTCYPFLTYDAHGNSSTDELYKQKFDERLHKFLDKHLCKWDKIIFSFLPTSRNREVVENGTYNDPKIIILPDREVYRRIFEEGSPGVNITRFPQCAHQHIEEIEKALNVTRYQTNRKRLFNITKK